MKTDTLVAWHRRTDDMAKLRARMALPAALEAIEDALDLVELEDFTSDFGQVQQFTAYDRINLMAGGRDYLTGYVVRQ